MSSLSASTSTSSTSAAFRPLSETDLERQPEEVFDLVEEIGKGSYGTVHRAILKENNLEVAIKKVQVADELHEIIKGGLDLSQMPLRNVILFNFIYQTR